MHLSSPEILQAGAVKGLIVKDKVTGKCPHRAEAESN